MGFERIAGTDLSYGLISYDRDGVERGEGPPLMSQALVDIAANEPITDIFFFCHGWQGDVPAAKTQYANWIGSFLTVDDYARAQARNPAFRPLLIGLHWPSRPWGDEELTRGSFAAAGAAASDLLVESYVMRLGSDPRIRAALRIIIDEARVNSAPDELPAPVVQAYLDLNAALGLGSEGVAGPPDADRQPFVPQAAFDAANQNGASLGRVNLGGLLGPLRQISYWTMKRRARTIGEGGMHDFLAALEHATAAKGTAIHLMGHSFGTIVVAGMIGGPNVRAALQRPVDSVVLVQGAVSLWSYAAQVPFGNAGAGYFNPLLTSKKIRGPLVTTRSKYDDAVRVLYPFASRIHGAPNFANQFPEFGGIGAFGIQGVSRDVCRDLTMLGATDPYAFEPGKVYNVDGSQFISHKEFLVGAHNDIAGHEVAHLIWAAAHTG